MPERLPFADRTLDLVLSATGWNDATNPERALAEAARVLEPRGQLLFVARLPGCFALFYDYLEGLLEECHLATHLASLHAHRSAQHASPEVWERRIAQGGLRLRRIEAHRFTWTFLDGAALFSHPAIRADVLPGWTALLPEGFLPFLQGRLDRLALERGGLRMEVPFVCVEAERP